MKQDRKEGCRRGNESVTVWREISPRSLKMMEEVLGEAASRAAFKLGVGDEVGKK